MVNIYSHLKYSRLPSLMWVVLTQSLDGFKREKIKRLGLEGGEDSASKCNTETLSECPACQPALQVPESRLEHQT